MIRCLPGEDKTNGFFVSCFVRQSPGARSAAPPNGGKAGKRKRGAQSDEQGAIAGRGTELVADNIKEGMTGSEEAAEVEAEGVDEAVEASKDEALAPKNKTAAQAERARRKKAAQKKRRKLEVDA